MCKKLNLPAELITVQTNDNSQQSNNFKVFLGADTAWISNHVWFTPS